MTDEPTVTYAVQDKVGIITLNRPHVLNAINRPMKTQFLAAFGQAEADCRGRAKGHAGTAG